MPEDSREERCFTGIAVSPGIVRAKVQMKGVLLGEPESRRIVEAEVAPEKARLQQALVKTRGQIVEMRGKIEQVAGSESASIFDAHLLLLEDATVLGEVTKLLESELRNVDRIYYEVIERYLESLRRIEDPYLRERAVDIEDVAMRVLRNLSPDEHSEAEMVYEGVEGEFVLVAHDLTPSDTASIDRNHVLGFATEIGSSVSHTAIMARSLNIPAVVGLQTIRSSVETGDEVLLDGYNGLLIIRPSDETLASYEVLKAEKAVLLDDLKELRDQETETADGHQITLSANIEFAHEVSQVQKQGAEGVGLFRTEFFYANEKKLRSENAQTRQYVDVAAAVAPNAVIIRTVDLGGDKLMPGLIPEPEPNPFLGWRGIRVCLQEDDIFRPQLRAILRASARGKVGVMFPFICCVEEIRAAKVALQEEKQNLRDAGEPFDENIEVGAMIEIPSAALMADELAREVDFFSIGTNDLVQYTLAVDRVNDRVADLFRSANPAVLKLIKQVIEAAHRNGIWAGICGEMAGDLLMTPLMIGFGVDELSVGASQLLSVRRAISRLNVPECQDLVKEISGLSSAGEVEQCCRNLVMKKYPELMS
ncbi:MAG: phosphoenolpyruvate--protein phosphotransferase [Verrucomicrobiales bacterium]|nr:phosphoenolpyruvate--protein phosphotransferase [Verrucomicrobiales bacterium]